MQRDTFTRQRRRVVLPVLLLLLCTGVAHAAEGDIEEVTLWTAEALSSGGTLTSKALSSHAMDPDQLLLKATSASGAADVKIEYQIAQDNAGTFGSSTANDPICSSTATEFSGQAPEEYHLYALPTAPTFRIVVTELGLNSDTLISATALFRRR